MKKVTIAIPVYNDEKYITEAVSSALFQDYESIEIIIVDDCSTDGTYEILKGFERTNDNIKLFRNDVNMGIAFNRNECIRNATGDYLCFLSSDDIYEPKFVSTMVKYNPYGHFSFTSYKVINGSGEEQYTYNVPSGLSQSELKVFAWNSALNNTMFTNYSTVFASLKNWEDHPFDESYNRCEDLEHFLRIYILEDLPLMLIGSDFVRYRIFPEMGTRKVINDIPKINAKTIANIRAELDERNIK